METLNGKIDQMIGDGLMDEAKAEEIRDRASSFETNFSSDPRHDATVYAESGGLVMPTEEGDQGAK